MPTRAVLAAAVAFGALLLLHRILAFEDTNPLPPVPTASGGCAELRSVAVLVGVVAVAVVLVVATAPLTGAMALEAFATARPIPNEDAGRRLGLTTGCTFGGREIAMRLRGCRVCANESPCSAWRLRIARSNLAAHSVSAIPSAWALELVSASNSAPLTRWRSKTLCNSPRPCSTSHSHTCLLFHSSADGATGDSDADDEGDGVDDADADASYGASCSAASRGVRCLTGSDTRDCSSPDSTPLRRSMCSDSDDDEQGDEPSALLWSSRKWSPSLTVTPSNADWSSSSTQASSSSSLSSPLSVPLGSIVVCACARRREAAAVSQ